MSRFAKIFVIMVVVLLALGTATNNTVQAQNKRPYRIVVVTHGQASDPFWSVVKRGVDAAAADMRVTAEYQAPGKFDMVEMSKLIDAAVATNPNGLVVSVPDADALTPSIQKAVKAGIPVISINSGSDVAEKLGVLAHIGQTEYEAGLGAGKRMGAAGAKNALCVNQEVGNAGLDLRCKGFAEGLKASGGKSTVLAVELADATGSKNRIAAALTADTTIDSILTLGPTGAAPALEALKAGGMVGKIKLATFDLSPEVLDALKAGNMLFAIDQQQYTQGYLAIVYMTLYLENLNTPGNLLIPTGPGFVTKDNAEKVINLSKAGTR